MKIDLTDEELEFMDQIFRTFKNLPFSGMMGKLLGVDKDTFKNAKDLPVIDSIIEKVKMARDLNPVDLDKIDDGV